MEQLVYFQPVLVFKHKLNEDEDEEYVDQLIFKTLEAANDFAFKQVKEYESLPFYSNFNISFYVNSLAVYDNSEH